jgi:hypothetical protein
MFDRRLIGDIAIATLLAVPTVALSRPQPTTVDHPSVTSPLVEQAGFASETSPDKVNLPAR